MKTIHARVAVLAALLAASAWALEEPSLKLHIHLTGLDTAVAPHIVDGHLILSVVGPYRHVGAAFSHEDWKRVHSFQLNRNGVFVLALPLPLGDARLVQYRLVVDGAWSHDPSNPRTQRDRATGATVSLADFPARSLTELGVWDPAMDGAAHFYFEGESGQRVSVAGTFNGWDPFIHELAETAPGRYELILDLAPGDYYYVFVYMGRRLSDPLNMRLTYSPDGRELSVITVARR
ncbi:MAG TPA: hypothetical protein PK625_00620 [Spirochaetales bacterium]|nr:hypothetical protein [Spirochaetales bacterium]